MITEAEEKLLNVLKTDVRASISDIARTLHLSRATVQVRIAKLERLGIIKGYTLELGKNYLENFVSAHVSVATRQNRALKVIDSLFKIPQISEIHSISGEYDLIAVIKTKNTEILDDILCDIALIEGVERTNSSVILATKYRNER